MKREKREKKKEKEKKILEAYQNFDYDITDTIKKNLDEKNSMIPRKVTNDDSSGLHLPSKKSKLSTIIR